MCFIRGKKGEKKQKERLFIEERKVIEKRQKERVCYREEGNGEERQSDGEETEKEKDC